VEKCRFAVKISFFFQTSFRIRRERDDDEKEAHRRLRRERFLNIPFASACIHMFKEDIKRFYINK
jgi:hypothetical protein